MITYELNVYRFRDDRPLMCEFASSQPWSIRNMLLAWRDGFQLANPTHFVEQVKRCSTLILSGGDTPTLIRRLRYTPEWIEHMQGKTIVAYSAGISALMTRSYNADHRILLEGLGILPFQSIVHYAPNKEWMADRLAQDCDLPVLCFDERSSIIIKR